MRTYIPIQLIQDNPYQTRFEENSERVATIALSIAKDGLLQPPMARSIDGVYQLAFGHTRTAAWKLCAAVQAGFVDGVAEELIAAVSGKDYSAMPLDVEELSDEQMFRHAVTENAQRADLSPIEEATAMQRAINDFQYTSDQAGALFGKSGSTVRGKVRLLDLPDTVRQKLHHGEIRESAARMLIVLSHMVPDSLEEACEEIIDGADPEDLVDDILRAKNSVKLIEDENFLVETKLFKHLPVLTDKDQVGLDQEKANHLLKPPSCTACPWYAKVGGRNYCGWSQCFERKAESQAITNLESCSKKTGIAIYEKEDGEMFVMDRWEDTHRNALKKRDADLRLFKAGRIQSYWHYLDENIPMNVALVAVGKLAEKYKKAKMQSQIDRGQIPDNVDPKQKIKALKEQARTRVVSNLYERIIFETIAPHFLPMMESIKSDALVKLFVDILDPSNDLYTNAENLTGKALLKHWRLGLICELWDRDLSWDARRNICEAKSPTVELRKIALACAEKWDVKLGKGFDQALAALETQIQEARQVAYQEIEAAVAAETGKGKKP